MNHPDQAHTIAPVSGMKMLRAMVGIGVICGLMIVLTYEVTLDPIKKNKAEALEKSIFEVLPGIVSKQAFRWDQNQGFVSSSGEEQQENLVYAGYNEEDKLVGVAIEASGPGFADILKVIYGYNPSTETVIGFYVLESKETPGLGDKIEKDENFLANFTNLDVSLTDDITLLKNQVVPVKKGQKENPWEIDGITGATISSRAIGNIIGASTEYWVPLIYKMMDDFKIKSEVQIDNNE